MNYLQVLLCLGLVTLAISQDDNFAENFGRRVGQLPRLGSKQNECSGALCDSQPLDFTAQEQQYYIEAIQPTTSTSRPTFRRRKTLRPITSHSKKTEIPEYLGQYLDEGNPSLQEQQHFNPSKHVVNTNFAKRRLPMRRPKSRVQDNEISSTTEGQDNKPEIHFTVSKEVDRDSAFRHRAQSIGEEEAEKPVPRSPFRPSAGEQPKTFQPNRNIGGRRRAFQRTSVPENNETENPTTKIPLTQTPNSTRQRFVLRPKPQVNSRVSLNPEEPNGNNRPLRKRKRPVQISEAGNTPLAAEIPVGRSINGGRRRKISLPTQKTVASEISEEKIPTPAPFIVGSSSALIPIEIDNSNGSLQPIDTSTEKPVIMVIQGEFNEKPVFVPMSLNSREQKPIIQLPMVFNNVQTVAPTTAAFFPESDVTIESTPKPRKIPGRDTINERLRKVKPVSTFNLATSTTPKPVAAAAIIEAAAAAAASPSTPGISPVPRVPPPFSSKMDHSSLFGSRKNIFENLKNRKLAMQRLLSPKYTTDTSTIANNDVEVTTPAAQKESVLQQSFKKRRPGLLGHKLEKETSSPVQESEVSGPNPSVPDTPVASGNVQENPNRRKGRRRKLSTTEASILSAQDNVEVPVATDDDPESSPNQQAPEGVDAEPQLPEPVKLNGRTPLLPKRQSLQKNRLNITPSPLTATPPPDSGIPTCEPNQRYSKFLKRCVNQYVPKSLG